MPPGASFRCKRQRGLSDLRCAGGQGQRDARQGAGKRRPPRRAGSAASRTLAKESARVDSRRHRRARSDRLRFAAESRATGGARIAEASFHRPVGSPARSDTGAAINPTPGTCFAGEPGSRGRPHPSIHAAGACRGNGGCNEGAACGAAACRLFSLDGRTRACCRRSSRRRKDPSADRWHRQGCLGHLSAHGGIPHFHTHNKGQAA